MGNYFPLRLLQLRKIAVMRQINIEMTNKMLSEKFRRIVMKETRDYSKLDLLPIF